MRLHRRLRAAHARRAATGVVIGFTGTPIELTDANTRAVFGDYTSVGATVPLYYESRLAKLALDEATRPRIDPELEEATEGEDVARKERLRRSGRSSRRWSVHRSGSR